MNTEDKNRINNISLSLKDSFSKPAVDQWRLEADRLLSKAPDVGQKIKLEVPGFNWQPIFTASEEISAYSPLARSLNSSDNSVKTTTILQAIPYPEPKRFNQALKHGLKNGLTGIALSFDRVGKMGLDPDQARVGDVGWTGVSIATIDDLSVALDGIALDKYPIQIDCGASGLTAVALLTGLLKKNNQSISKLSGSLNFDPLGVLAADGSLPAEIKQIYDELSLCLKWSGKINSFTTAHISTVAYQETGLSAPEQLGCLLATGVAYFKEMETRGISFEQFQKELSFSLSVGSNLFVEVAKLRAVRMVWGRLMELTEISPDLPVPPIHVQSLGASRTIYDQQVNMLRGTVETFAAIVGGADSLKIAPLDYASGLPDKFSLRMTRNTQLILSEESHLNEVLDPAGGSHYIEKLTDSIAEEAWNKFIEIELIGGMLQALESGLIHQWRTETIARRSERLVRRKDVIVGSSQYLNLAENKIASEQIEWEDLHNSRADELTLYKKNSDRLLDLKKLDGLTANWSENRTTIIDDMTSLAKSGATIGELAAAVRAQATGSIRIGAMIPFKPSELFENLRSMVEDYITKQNKQPNILLTPIGKGAKLQPRIEFTRDYFAVAGYRVECDRQFVTADEAIFEINNKQPALVVLIAADKDYPELVPAMCELIKEKSPNTVIALAGYPEDFIDSFKEAGVSEFIYDGADIHAGLSKLSHQMGVLP